MINTEYKEEVIDGKTYRLHKFHAISGREIISKYPLSSMPKVGDYRVNEETMLKLMSYVCVLIDVDKPMRLSTIELINSHVISWETLAKIEIAMMEYNVSFFQNGQISNFLKDFAQNIQLWITKTLTASLGQLSPKEEPPSTN